MKGDSQGRFISMLITDNLVGDNTGINPDFWVIESSCNERNMAHTTGCIFGCNKPGWHPDSVADCKHMCGVQSVLVSLL